MLQTKIIKLFIVFCIIGSFSFTPSFSLTESVDLFGQINSADLVLNDIWIEPENPTNGEKVTVHGSLYNAGIIPSGNVSDAITIGYLVNGELAEITLLEDVLPGIENGVEISSGPIFDAISGNYIVTVIVNYHDTVSHLRDNPENNIVQKIFQIGTSTPSLITTEIYQQYDSQTDKQKIKIEGEITDIFEQTLVDKEVIIDIKEISQQKIITDSVGKFTFETDFPSSNEIIDITTRLEGNSSFHNQTQEIFPVKLNEKQSALALKINLESNSNNTIQNSPLTVVLFQDSYENLFRITHTDNHIEQDLIINDFFVMTVPGNHEYIAEIYVDGRIQDAFQNYLQANKILKKEVLIFESAEVKFKVIDELGNPQNNIQVENWIYHSNTNEEGVTNWIKVIPTFTENEPYVAKAVFPDGKIAWSEPFQIESEEKKMIEIIKRG